MNRKIPETEIYNLNPGMVQGICRKCQNFVLYSEKWEWDERKPRIVHRDCMARLDG